VYLCHVAVVVEDSLEFKIVSKTIIFNNKTIRKKFGFKSGGLGGCNMGRENTA
jgi:hypothetical protein